MRGLIVVGSLGVVAVWLAAAGSSGPEPAVTPVATAGAAQQAPAAVRSLTEEAEGLWQRLRAAPTPLTPGRNPFAFAPTPRERGAARPAPRSTPREPAPVVPVPSQSALRLIGIAENGTADGAARTAVLSGFGQLFLVKVGEEVTPRYTVTAIGPDVVELHDVAAAAPLRLALR